ncbi:hypothetical protein BTE77_31375 [Ensifer adhaerens]|nr:hypothetical protein BTE77_31375 [Ensifer adhaerens]
MASSSLDGGTRAFINTRTGDFWTQGALRVGNARYQNDGNIYMPWAGDYLSNVLNSKITPDGRAYPRKIGGGDLNFHWSGQSGQPPWIWGGTNGVDMYVYNPSNFSVKYAINAGSAGNADTVDGVHGLPEGDAIGCYVWAKRINNTDAVAFGQNIAGSNLSPGGGNSTNTGTLTGTYQCRGSIQAGANTTGAYAIFLKIG